MDDVRELLEVFAYAQADEAMIFHGVETSNQRIRLYRLLLADPTIDDKEACVRLFGNGQQMSRYFATKSKLKSELLSALLKVEFSQPHTSAIFEALHTCATKFAQAETLISFEAYTASKELLDQVLTMARAFCFTKYEFLSMTALLRHSKVASLKDMTSVYDSALDELTKRWTAEIEAERIRDLLGAYLARTTKGLSDSDQNIAELVIQMDSLLRSFPESVQIQHSFYQLRVSIAVARAKFSEVEEMCQEALNFLNLNPNVFSKTSYGAFAYKAMIATHGLRRFDKCREYIQICDQLFTLESSSAYNYSLVQLSKTTAYMHMGEYQKAAELCNEAVHSPNFTRSDKASQEFWQLMRAALVFAVLTEIGTIEPRTRQLLFKDFSLLNFLNSMPIHSTDKSGFNIVVQIIHALLLLSQGNIEGTNARVEALRQYRITHVKEQEHPRAFIIMKLLAALIKSDYDVSYMQKRYADQIARLHTRDENDPCAQLESMEIIAYDVLWDHCIKHVENLQSTNRLLRARPRHRSG